MYNEILSFYEIILENVYLTENNFVFELTNLDSLHIYNI